MKKYLVICAIFLISCGEKTVNIKYDLAQPVKVDVSSQSNYATMDGEYEQIGTITAIRFKNEYSQSNDTFYVNRTFESDASRGYLKKSYPAELAYRTPDLKITALDFKVIDINGYENFDSLVVAKITIPDRWKKQISRMTRKIDLDRIEKQRFDLTHILLGNIPLNTNVTRQLASMGRLPLLPNVQIDSVVTKGIREIEGKRCLEYNVYLQEKELFPYFIWEQHTSSVKGGIPFKEYHPKDAFYNSRHEITINLENGIPCQEREFKFGVHGMQNPETKDSVFFKSQITHERLYTFL